MTDITARLQAGLAGRYRIERQLGEGGMATVYLVEDLKHHRQLALKVLRPELTAGLGAERFLREIDVAAHLQHPHILPLFDSGELGEGTGIFYFVMPYVEGESLRARIDREKQLPIADALRIVTEVADALGAAHARGIIHRDIKPENILLVGDHAVVADFGIARAMSQAGGDRLTQSGTTLGTPQYMSPEQATSGDVDGGADIYSLACVGYEMLTGAPPFAGATAQAVMARHMVEAVPGIRTVRGTVPVPVEQALLRALAKVPADRYATAPEFAAALLVATTAQLPPPRRHLRWPVVVALAGTALAAAAGLWWAGRGHRDAPNRVAVLSFANLSPDSADAYLAQGLSEEIASRLGRFPEIRVASRNSVQRLERADTGGASDRARALGFGYLVEGSVRRAGGMVRVAVRLIDAADGSRRLDRSYDRASTDLLALQDEIALEVARAVVGYLAAGTVPGRPPSDPNPAAHDQLLRGNYYLAQRTPRALARAVASYGAAAQLDSNYALAFAKLAHAHVVLLDWNWTYEGLPPDTLLVRGMEAADRAIQLDPRLADAWMARGGLLGYEHPGTLAGVREALQRAVDLSPGNADAHSDFGVRLRQLDRDSDAAAQFHEALGIEPDRPIVLVHLAWIDMAGRRYADARRWLDSAAAVNPGFYQAYAERASLRLIMGDTAGARSDAQTAARLRPASEPFAGEDVLVALSLAQGDTAAGGHVLRLHAGAPGLEEHGVHRAVAWAALLAAAGRRSAAMDFLEGAKVAPAHLRMHLKEPRFDGLREQARFGVLMERLRVREDPGA